MKMASVAIATDMNKKIITTYCDSGKVCTVWSFLLADWFGYKNVKVYNGSAQEW